MKNVNVTIKTQNCETINKGSDMMNAIAPIALTLRQSRILNNLFSAGPEGIHRSTFTHAELLTIGKLIRAGLVWREDGFFTMSIDGLDAV